MKLSPYILAIEKAYNDILLDIQIHRERPQQAFNYIRRRPLHIIPRPQSLPTPPRFVTEYEPMTHRQAFENKEKLVMLSAFEATYHDSITPLTRDMVPLIIDNRASISLSPHKTDFISPIRPVQNVQIKGTASGLMVEGVCDLSYTFHNDNGELQTMVLRGCLYVPQCVVRLICPRLIGAETQNPVDGFNATHINPTLTVQGKPTTINYDFLSNLPILFTAPGIKSFTRYASLSSNSEATSLPPNHQTLPNLTKQQRQKMYLHEVCAHEGFRNLNRWIRQGKFPGVNPSLAEVPDPSCTFCNFGKARKKCHNSHTGHISTGHTKPGQRGSSDGLESGTPGRPFTTKGLPSKLRYNYVSFWVDHMSTFVYVTFHSSKAATELVHSKTEFESYAS
jgi:hypothetical protein